WLAAYKRLFLRAGEKQKVTLTIRPQELASYDAAGNRVIEAGRLVVSVGGQQPGFTGCLSAPTTSVLTAQTRINH
ncbi:MAG TPA: fibronectin type III-like domain-contianing protein, partial [Candidatus Saccharicenans sp.]|nr:fibronectin type III-like domain-contianing protein [Candidatus Saccharicenans sp.]